ncbi:MAG: hypothetical protein HOB84_14110 [Candidatus Marinimicrobia bacterium]|nr:hypothetical protein [Candidatus Neomarinimicrobiota bacterium]MBT4715898.1 hypothetical protein [Candidatus Neomarinimicrobiota bacterium]
MLVAVLMIFTIFSFTGVAVLNVSYLSNSTSMETINNIKLQYATESTINEALWRINTGVDSLVDSDVDGIVTIWDASLNILSVNVDKFEMEAEISLDLSEDTHFDRALASDETITTNGYDTEIEDENRSRFFTFMPEVDLDYFIDNAVAIHNESYKTWDYWWEVEMGGEGIHVFTGDYVELKNCRFLNSTLVFTGTNITFEHQIQIDAPVPVDSADAMPALVFTNEDNYFEIEAEGKNYDREDKINGAIYTAGTIVLKKGQLSGPIVGKTITMEHGVEYNNQIDFKDTEHPKHYRWHKGFKHKKHYDWPKQIGRWKTKKWGKKHHHA